MKYYSTDLTDSQWMLISDILSDNRKRNVKDGGTSVSSAEGVKFVKKDGQYAVFEAGSGKYSFLVND
ncbi:MAG: hypothetical protein LBN71_00315 [Tannerella sp.]|nr:hypothetical protein [Tannerella sp.]